MSPLPLVQIPLDLNISPLLLLPLSINAARSKHISQFGIKREFFKNFKERLQSHSWPLLHLELSMRLKSDAC